jgi:hypothetical protein
MHFRIENKVAPQKKKKLSWYFNSTSNLKLYNQPLK